MNEAMKLTEDPDPCAFLKTRRTMISKGKTANIIYPVILYESYNMTHNFSFLPRLTTVTDDELERVKFVIIYIKYIL